MKLYEKLILQTTVERFNKFTKRDKTTGCLNWIASRRGDGYGRMWIGSKREGTLRKEMTHRVAWMIAGKKFDPKRPFLTHKCDNPACCEVTHLRPGTSTSNNRDRSDRDRSRVSRRGLPRGVQPSTSGGYQARQQCRSRQIYIGHAKTIAKAAALVDTAGGWRHSCRKCLK